MSQSLDAWELDRLDINLVEAIVAEAGPLSTAFLDIFRAYNDVLLQQGLDPADDTIYYRFILKLGIVTGANWGDRWERWKQQQLNSPSTSLASTTLDDEDDVAGSTPPTRESSRSPTPTRTWRTDGTESEFSTYTDLTDDEAPPSIYSASTVGFRPPPSASSAYAASACMSPPQRTSTPLVARNRVVRSHSPAYPSPSDTPGRQPSAKPRSAVASRPLPRTPSPQSHTSSTLPHISRPHSTPVHLHAPSPRRVPPLQPAFLPTPLVQRDHSLLPSPSYVVGADPQSPSTGRHIAKATKQISKSRALIEAELRREDDEREQRRLHEARADRFYQLGLLGRCWDVWRRSLEWIIVSLSRYLCRWQSNCREAMKSV